MKNLCILAVFCTAVGGFLALDRSHAQPQRGGAHHEHFAKCARACADCQLICDDCFHHCAGLVAKGQHEHAKTMHACLDCAEFCALAARLSGRHSHYAVPACDGCAKVCDDCAAHCEKFKDDKMMADCARECRQCAKACRTMIGHLKH